MGTTKSPTPFEPTRSKYAMLSMWTTRTFQVKTDRRRPSRRMKFEFSRECDGQTTTEARSSRRRTDERTRHSASSYDRRPRYGWILILKDNKFGSLVIRMFVTFWIYNKFWKISKTKIEKKVVHELKSSICKDKKNFIPLGFGCLEHNFVLWK